MYWLDIKKGLLAYSLTSSVTGQFCLELSALELHNVSVTVWIRIILLCKCLCSFAPCFCLCQNMVM